MKKVLLIALLALTACEKENTQTCALLLGYSGNGLNDTLVATYDNGYYVEGTKDDLPFDNMICADVWGFIQTDCKLRIVSKDKWSYENEGIIYRFYTVNEIYVDAEVYRNAVIGACLDISEDPDYCAHPRIIGYLDENLNLIKYDFKLCG